MRVGYFFLFLHRNLQIQKKYIIMKQKLLLFALAVLASIGCVKAQNSADGHIVIPDVEIMQGKTAILMVRSNFNYPTDIENYAYRGVQVEFVLPDGITAIDESDGISDYLLGYCPKMTTGFQPRRNDGCTVFLTYQVDDKNMPEGAYDMFYCTISCASDLAPGEYTVTTSKLELSANTNPISKLNPSNFSFKIKVIPYERRILEDDIAEVEENRGVAEDIQLNRSFKKDMWSTICLPFDMSTDQVTEVFGEGTKVAEYTKDDATEDEKGNIDKVTIYFETFADGIEANYPFIICPTKDVENITLDEILVNPNEEDAKAEYDNGKTGSRRQVYGTFTGTLKNSTIPAYNLFISSNKFYITKEDKAIKAYRGYFHCNNVDDAYGVSNSVNVNFFVDGEATAIEGILAPGMEKVDGNVYTVSGVNMGRAEDVMNTLPAGIYIVNNKKVIVK